MNLEFVSELQDLVGLVVTIFGVPIAIWQLWRIQRTNRNNSIAKLYEESRIIRGYFVDRPDLKKYCSKNVEIDKDHEDYELVETIAEILLNFQEHKTLLRHELGHDWEAWRAGRDNQIRRSPIMRELIAADPDKYVLDFLHAANELR